MFGGHKRCKAKRLDHSKDNINDTKPTEKELREALRVIDTKPKYNHLFHDIEACKAAYEVFDSAVSELLELRKEREGMRTSKKEG